MDPLLKRRLGHINQTVWEMRVWLSCGAGGRSHRGSVLSAGDGL